MPLKITLALVILSLGVLYAQSTPVINGSNEAKFIYRTVDDSLNVYFTDTFSFGTSYKNFSFGMKFIAELPKYSTSQAELLEDLSADVLGLGWKELYASYTKDAYLLHAGTLEDTFGNGITFRSFKDIEFDTDNRMTGFRLGYDDKLRLKTLYGAIVAPGTTDKLDIAYGADAEYPVLEMLTLGGSAIAMRNLTAFGSYSQNDVFAGRMKLQYKAIELNAEYAQRELYRRGTGLAVVTGDALYATLGLDMYPMQLGGAYKAYNHFQYRLQDMPVANHHNETLADDQATGADEEGFQAWASYALGDALSFNLDYAEAWNTEKDKQMNDAYAAVEWTSGNMLTTLSYSHVEKLDDTLSHWQKEAYPALVMSFPAGKMNMVLNAEFKIVDKQSYDVLVTHYKPKLQADLTLGKLGLSLGGGSEWEDFSTAMASRYWANMEAKYPILEGTELVLFAGKEPGGKVCRNGVCRYVAPFSGLRLELNTRF